MDEKYRLIQRLTINNPVDSSQNIVHQIELKKFVNNFTDRKLLVVTCYGDNCRVIQSLAIIGELADHISMYTNIDVLFDQLLKLINEYNK